MSAWTYMERVELSYGVTRTSIRSAFEINIMIPSSLDRVFLLWTGKGALTFGSRLLFKKKIKQHRRVGYYAVAGGAVHTPEVSHFRAAGLSRFCVRFLLTVYIPKNFFTTPSSSRFYRELICHLHITRNKRRSTDSLVPQCHY